jgi:hypothetical protein
MVLFYHEITPDELHEICLNHIGEIRQLLGSMLQWVKENKMKGGISNE